MSCREECWDANEEVVLEYTVSAVHVFESLEQGFIPDSLISVAACNPHRIRRPRSEGTKFRTIYARVSWILELSCIRLCGARWRPNSTRSSDTTDVS